MARDPKVRSQMVANHVSPKSWLTFGVTIKNVILMAVLIYVEKKEI